MYCKQCGTEIENGVKYCPSCGKPLEKALEPIPKRHKSIFKRWWFWVISAVVLLFILIIASSPSQSPTYDMDCIKASYLNEYSSTTTIGQAFDDYFGTTAWTKFEKNGKKYVQASGNAPYPYNAFMKINFHLTDERFTLDGIIIDEKILSRGDYDPVMKVIYHGPENAAVKPPVDRPQIKNSEDPDYIKEMDEEIIFGVNDPYKIYNNYLELYFMSRNDYVKGAEIIISGIEKGYFRADDERMSNCRDTLIKYGNLPQETVDKLNECFQ